ncbi:non-POU domain-containing octamer-binding protein-like isoform X2 [Ylistrum balloti]|uniref:non-POU domain-containing octamer-binding protein-like isoform X2 n=1 Tax=Ylistrum balloti TaxID=509963 RepID=UPI002905D297|nr:non-POU domain-containing octamer-binding protein-like isoform X2 [Ylistrum balloti]
MSEKTATKPVTPAKKEPTENKTPTPVKPKPQQDGNKHHDQQNRNRGGGVGGGGGDRGGHGGPRRGGGGGGGRGRFNNNRNYSQGGGGGERHSHAGHKNQPEVDSNDDPSGPKEDLKFTGRCRLFVGNLTPDVTEEEFKGMFTKFGEISELFVNGAKGFGFIRMDYRHNAEAAKAALDGTQRKGRSLRVRFANHGAAIRVKNLSPFVSNELLHQSFSQFGDIERAIVCVDDRGRSSGEGIIEFARKPGASQAMKRINEGVFLMSAYPRPVFVEPLEQKDEEDGLPEKFLPRNEHCRKDREKEPRFAPPGSFEYRFAQRWKELDELEKQQHERVKQEMEDARIKLEAEMEGAMYEFQAEQIRADLLRQQEELQRIEEMRQEQMRRRQEMDMRRQDDNRMVREEEERRREMIMRGEGSGMRGGRGPMDRSGQMEQPGMRGDGMRGDGMRGDGMRGEGMRGEGMRGEGMRGDGMRGEGMRGEGQRGRSGGPPPVPPPPAPPAAMGIENRQQNEGSMGSGFGGGSGGNMGSGGMGGSQGSMQGQSQGMGGQGQGMRQSRFDQQGGNYGNGNFGGRGGMGGQGGGMSGGNGGGGMQGGGNMYGGGGMSGNMGGGRGGMNERRRQEAGGPRDDYGDMKRMRRY